MWSQSLEALKTQEFQEQVLKLSIALTPAALTSLTQPTPMPHGVYLLLSDLGRKNSGLVYRWFCMICRHQPEFDAVALPSNIGVVRKENGKQNPSSGQNIKHYILLLICLGIDMDREKTYMDSREIANSLSKWSRTWKRHSWEISDKEGWGRDRDCNFEMGTECEDICDPHACSPPNHTNYRSGFQ